MPQLRTLHRAQGHPNLRTVSTQAYQPSMICPQTMGNRLDHRVSMSLEDACQIFGVQAGVLVPSPLSFTKVTPSPVAARSLPVVMEKHTPTPTGLGVAADLEPFPVFDNAYASDLLRPAALLTFAEHCYAKNLVGPFESSAASTFYTESFSTQNSTISDATPYQTASQRTKPISGTAYYVSNDSHSTQSSCRNTGIPLQLSDQSVLSLDSGCSLNSLRDFSSCESELDHGGADTGTPILATMHGFPYVRRSQGAGEGGAKLGRASKLVSMVKGGLRKMFRR